MMGLVVIDTMKTVLVLRADVINDNIFGKTLKACNGKF